MEVIKLKTDIWFKQKAQMQKYREKSTELETKFFLKNWYPEAKTKINSEQKWKLREKNYKL